PGDRRGPGRSGLLRARDPAAHRAPGLIPPARHPVGRPRTGRPGPLCHRPRRGPRLTPPRPRGLFVTGSDTGVGKTLVAAGLLLPYSGGETTAHLAARIGLPLLVVGRMALGTINHLCLTLGEAGRRGLPVAGCLLNRTEPEVAPHEGGNLDLIAAVAGQRP